MYLCVRGVDFIEVPVPRQESEQSCMCVRGVECIEVPVPRQKSEQSCICVLEVSIVLKCLYQGRKVSSHVFVC